MKRHFNSWCGVFLFISLPFLSLTTAHAGSCDIPVTFECQVTSPAYATKGFYQEFIPSNPLKYYLTQTIEENGSYSYQSNIHFDTDWKMTYQTSDTTQRFPDNWSLEILVAWSGIATDVFTNSVSTCTNITSTRIAGNPPNWTDWETLLRIKNCIIDPTFPLTYHSTTNATSIMTNGIYYYHYTNTNNGIYETRLICVTNTTTVTDEYTTYDLLENLKAKLDALPYPTNWSSSGNATLTLAADETSASGNKMKYRFTFPSDRDVKYRLDWDEVTVYADGSSSARHLYEQVTGNGEIVISSEHEAQLPKRSGVVTVQNISIIMVADSSGGGAGGSAGGGFAGSGGAGGMPGAGSVGNGGNGCASCGPGTPSGFSGGGVFASISTGTASGGSSAGSFQISEGQPSPAMATPSALVFSSSRDANEVERIMTNGVIRQVKMPQGLADVVTNNAFKYEIRFYATSQIGAKSGGVYAVSGTANTIWRIENPEASSTNCNRLIITEIHNQPSSLTKVYSYQYYPNDSKWIISYPDSLREEETSVVLNLTDKTRQVKYVVRTPNGPNVYVRTDLYKRYDWGEAIKQSQVGDPPNTQTTTYEYYTDQSNVNGNMIPLKHIIYPNGYWERYEYVNGRKTKTVAQSGNNAIETSDVVNRVTLYDYTPIDSLDDGNTQPFSPRQVTEKLKNHEISHTYYVISPALTKTIQCQTPGANFNDPGKLVTTVNYYTNGSNSGRLQNVVNPDGTRTTYEYTLYANETIHTKTVATGQADGSGVVTYGTRTTYSYGTYGELLSNVTVSLPGGTVTIASESYSNWDAFNRAQTVTFLDGTTVNYSYGCCGLESETDREGVTTEYDYDDLKRVKHKTMNNISLEYFYDAAGNVTNVTRHGNDASTMRLKSAAFDTAGRLTYETSAFIQGVSSYTYGYDGNGQTVKTTTMPDGGTRIETSYQDGSIRIITGTAVQPVRYAYDIELEGGYYRAYTKTTKLKADSTDSQEWEKTYVDMLGRAYKTVYSDNSYSQSVFNNLGQLVKEIDPDNVTRLYAYNGKGELEYTTTDMNGDGQINPAGLDRVSRVIKEVGQRDSYNVQRVTTYVWPTTGDAPVSVRVHETALNAQKMSLSWDTQGGRVTTSRVNLPGNGTRTVTITAPDQTQTVSVYQNGQLQSISRKESNGTQLTQTSLDYDAHGRQWHVIDLFNGTTTYGYNEADQVTSVTTSGSSGPTLTTSTYYDKSMRATNITYPDNKSMTMEYYPGGLLKRSYGSHGYPAAYGYDAQGRMTRMTNWTSFSTSSGQRVTSWSYHPIRGWLQRKTYPDANSGQPGTLGVDYSYTSGGRLSSRTWARSVTTTYINNAAGDVQQISYSDGTTPGVTYAYNRLGLPQTVTRNGITSSLDYTTAGQLFSESFSGTGWAGFGVTNVYDNQFRRQSVTLGHSSGTLHQSGFTYHPTSGRFYTATHGTYTATYSYVPNSTLVGQVDFRNSGVTHLSTSRQYDYLNRLISIQNNVGASPVTSYAYQYNQASQRTNATWADGSRWQYQYDDLDQVTSGKHYWSNADGAVGGQQYEYTHDDIGNRKSTAVGGNPLRQSGYTVNAANQYSSRTVPNKVDITGEAHADATVTINDQPTTRHGTYFHGELQIDNTTDAAYQAVTNMAILNQTTSDLMSTNVGYVFVPKNSEAFQYDADGNLTSDGRWTYFWDAENRLIMMKAIKSNLPDMAWKRLEFAYDYQGRRIQKRVFTQLEGGTAVLDLKYFYDGWNLLAEVNSGNQVVRSYVWGLDLSGSVQGAGGVGGLLMVKEGSGGGHFVGYDGNGNVVTMVNASSGIVSARYEYGPFGEPIRATGPMAKANPFRFSTKYTDNESDLVYYGYRYYNPSTGRWPNRDPIGEQGGMNLFAFVGNDPVNQGDPLGLAFDFNMPPPGSSGSSRNTIAFPNVPENGYQPPLDAFLFPIPTVENVAPSLIEIYVPVSAVMALSEGQVVAAAGSYALGKVNWLGRIPGVSRIGSSCCVKVRGAIEWFKKPFKHSGGKVIETCEDAAKGPLRVDPADLRLPPTRAEGADPFKLADQIKKYGTSTEGMPPIQVTLGANGEMMINDGVTRATRGAMTPGTTVPVQVIEENPALNLVNLPKVGERTPGRP
jgi:RHS repeat-associated protein